MNYPFRHDLTLGRDTGILPAMQTTNSTTTNLPAVGERVQLHPRTDAWMAGDRFGTVERVSHRGPFVTIRMDRSGLARTLAAHYVTTVSGGHVYGS